MRVLVTGASGFIGSHLSQQLIRKGHAVVGVDAFIDYYPRSVKEGNLSALRTTSTFEFHELDLRSAALEPVVDGCDAVVHLAAMPGLPKSWTDFELYSSCNLVATQRLADACVNIGVDKWLQISTSSVYGRYAVGDESMPTRPVSPYGVTKLAAEQLLVAYHETRGLPVTILRYFSIYGPRQRPDMAYNIFIEALLDERPIQVFGDGHQTRSSTYVGDCVAGTMAALEAAPVGEVFNIGGGVVTTLLSAVEIMADDIGVSPEIVHLPARDGDQRETAADTTKAMRSFGYVAQVAPAEGLVSQVDWQRDRRLAEEKAS